MDIEELKAQLQRLEESHEEGLAAIEASDVEIAAFEERLDAITSEPIASNLRGRALQLRLNQAHARGILLLRQELNLVMQSVVGLHERVAALEQLVSAEDD